MGALLGRFAAGVLVGAAAAVPFLLIMWLVMSESETLEKLDRGVAGAVNDWALNHSVLVTCLEVLERVTSPWSFRLAVLFSAALLWRAGSRRLALWAMTTMAVGGLLNPILKEVVQRARPVFPEPVASAESYSFPSGHAQSSMLGVALMLMIVLPRLQRRGKAAAWIVGVLLVGITGWDRIGLGVHYVSDVVAGWGAALAVVAGATIAFDLRRHGHELVGGTDPPGSRPLIWSAQGDRRSAALRARGIPALLNELRALVGRLLLGAAGVWSVLVLLGLTVVALDEIVWPLTQEESVVQWLAAHRTRTWTEIMTSTSWLADTLRIQISLVVGAVTFRLLFNRWLESAFVVAAVAVQGLTFLLTQALISRSRPAVEQLYGGIPTSSFPSGHAGAAFTLYGSLALVLAWHTRRRWLTGLVWLLLLLVPIGVASARLYAGMHFPSDIGGSVVNSVLSITLAARLILFAGLTPQLRDVLNTPRSRTEPNTGQGGP